MKLMRWALAGASAYVIYRYTIGLKREGKPVFVMPVGAGMDAQPRRGEARR